MIMGSYLLALATVAIVLSAIGHFFIARGNQAYAVASRWFYFLGTGLVIVASAYLISLFLNDRFEFSYVSGYSSIDLASNYKITSFWAGQEGSFLLWALFGVILGLWVRVKAKEQLGWVMFFYLLSLLFLFTLMNISSPFKMNAAIPPDGRGLNPLLQNYWMQIHPPVVFIGYAATFVPFAFAMAALATNKYDQWVKLTFPWAIFSVFTLGAGIFLGGYWAYETLGWGGYWAWDPVENASLVPWLGSIALVHGMILEKNKGSFRKTNLFLAIITFLMVIYGTFLTRSGVLADFSVHSFVDLGLNAYLVIFLIGFTAVSFGLLIYRGRNIDSAESGRSPLTQEFVVYLGMLFVILSAFLVLLGMSSPLLTRLFGDPSAVDISFYVLTNLPIAIIVGLILGFSGILSWGKISPSELLKKLPLPVIISLILTAVALFLSISNIAHLLFIFSSAFALITNAMSLIGRIKKKGYSIIHADLTHAGVGLMLIGIIISSAYSTSDKIVLAKNQSGDVLGFTMNYSGTTRISQDREQVNLSIEHNDSRFEARPVFVMSNQGMVRNPFIKKYLFYDLYISPEEVKTVSNSDSSNIYVLAQGHTIGHEDYAITFSGFESMSHMEGGVMSIGAKLDLETPTGEKVTVTPQYIIQASNIPVLEPANLPGSDLKVYLLKLNADQKMISIGITEADNADQFRAREIFIADVSRKPMINLVWLGLVLIIFGSALGTYRRIKQIQ